ncbi:MAG: DUF4124 domain-containing protein [Candidatus Thiodiazotropha sp.]
MLSRIFYMLLLSLSTAALAETYRWVNEDGVVTYSQTPPVEGESETVNIKSGPSSDAAASRKKLQELRQNLADKSEDRALKKAEKKQQAEELAIKKHNCESARKNLEQLIGLGNRRYKVGDEYLHLTEKQRQQMMQKARDQVKEFCGK